MSVTVNDVALHDERQVGLDIADGPVLTKKYGQRQYRVTEVVVTYRRRNGEPWKPTAVDLSGPYVKKDGTDGVDSNRDHLWSRDDWGAIGWLSELVERYMPEVYQ